MLNVIWLAMMLVAVMTALFTGKMAALTQSIVVSAHAAFQFALGLTGILSLWLGIMKIAEAAGLLNLLVRVLQPILIRLFPDVPKEHPAFGAITFNLAANMLGLQNGATPFGLRAMTELEKLNSCPGVATNAMCTFVALHSSNLQIIPVNAIAILVASGAFYPGDIVVPILISSCITVCAAILLCRWCERWRWFRLPAYTENHTYSASLEASS